MKKLILMIAYIVFCMSKTHAQTDTIMYAPNLHNSWHYICFNLHERAIIYAPTGCTSISWLINNDQILTDDPIILDGNLAPFYSVNFVGGNCGQYAFSIIFRSPVLPDETTTELWKHQHFPIELSIDSLPELPSSPPNQHYEFLWSTGETSETIVVSEPGIYTCDVSDMCATATQAFVVRDNVECYRATVDLETNLNKVTWQVTPEQAEYISQVKVERDGFVVGTAPYEQGYFMDNIGSENAARNYRLTGITTDGTECPIPSYQKGTLHVDYSPNASNPNKLNMAWTPPFIEEGAPVSVTYFQICKYDPNTGEVTVVDQIGANNTIGSYDISLFDGGYATVAALFSEGKAYEDLAFSNLTEDILGIEGDGPSTGSGTLTVYPNPAKDCVTIEGTGTLIITNTMGQTLLTKKIDGKTTFELPQGMYFVKMNGATRKIVVE